MIIYKATNTISNKVYIGKTVGELQNRINTHKSASKKKKSKFYNAINSYGFHVFNWEVIDSADSEDELNELEILHIRNYNSIQNGYNMVEGGTGGYNEYAVIANKKRKGKRWADIYSKEGLAVMKECSVKISERLVEYNKSLPQSERIRRAKVANKARTDMGYKHSDETKEKIRNSQKNITYEMRHGKEAALHLSKKISKTTKEAMKNVDWESLMKKALKSRELYWSKKHHQQHLTILELKQQGKTGVDIAKHLNVSIRTYYNRLNELKEMNMI